MTAPLPLSDLESAHLPLDDTKSESRTFLLYGSIAVLLFGPLAYGAVDLWAISTCELAASVLFGIWLISNINSGFISVRGNSALTAMGAFALLIVVQLLSGRSAYAFATLSALELYTAYGLIGFLISNTLTRTSELRRVAVILASYGALVALFAVLQSLVSNENLRWVHVARGEGWVYGPYVNHNHYAGLMELLVPIPLVFAFTKYASGRKRWLAAGAAAFMGATIFLSGSRGGMAALIIQAAIFFWFLSRERIRSGAGLAMGGLLLISIACIAFIGGGEVSERISTLQNTRSDIAVATRLAIYRDSLHMFAQRPLFGWGLATFSDVYPRFQSFYGDQFVNRAHNDYLQLLTETGIVGFLIAVWFLTTVVRRAIRKARNWSSDVDGAVALASLIAIIGILIHGFVDSNLQIPGNAMLFYAFCCVAVTDTHYRNHRREHRERDTPDLVAESAAHLAG